MRFYPLSLALVCACFTLSAAPWGVAGSCQEVASFAPVADQVRKYVDQYGAANVLLVADIDNTLLAMDNTLGSDQWFEWQIYLLANEPDSPMLVAKDFGGLLEVQGLLFATTHMHPPEADQPELVAQMQDQGIDTVVLTSRGDDYRPATIRELKRSGYEFASTAPTINLFARSGSFVRESDSRFTPYDLKQPEQSGLSAAEVKAFRLSSTPREVSYGDGVMMVAGQHKGAMLLILLHMIDHKYKAVVYVDDHGRHVLSVYDALTRRGYEVSAMRYTHQDVCVKRFNYAAAPKQASAKRWKEIDRALDFFKAPQVEAETVAP